MQKREQTAVARDSRKNIKLCFGMHMTCDVVQTKGNKLVISANSENADEILQNPAFH